MKRVARTIGVTTGLCLLASAPLFGQRYLFCKLPQFVLPAQMIRRTALAAGFPARTGASAHRLMENGALQVVLAGDRARLGCTPRSFDVVPGQPIRLVLTVQADTATPIRLRLPTDPLLIVRATERFPLRRTSEGKFLHQRVIIWQALEPGMVKLNSIAVAARGQRLLFPEITITVRDPGP